MFGSSNGEQQKEASPSPKADEEEEDRYQSERMRQDQLRAERFRGERGLDDRNDSPPSRGSFGSTATTSAPQKNETTMRPDPSGYKHGKHVIYFCPSRL